MRGAGTTDIIKHGVNGFIFDEWDEVDTLIISCLNKREDFKKASLQYPTTNFANEMMTLYNSLI